MKSLEREWKRRGRGWARFWLSRSKMTWAPTIFCFIKEECEEAARGGEDGANKDSDGDKTTVDDTNLTRGNQVRCSSRRLVKICGGLNEQSRTTSTWMTGLAMWSKVDGGDEYKQDIARGIKWKSTSLLAMELAVGNVGYSHIRGWRNWKMLNLCKLRYLQFEAKPWPFLNLINLINFRMLIKELHEKRRRSKGQIWQNHYYSNWPASRCLTSNDRNLAW